jgi:hypothetical protein
MMNSSYLTQSLALISLNKVKAKSLSPPVVYALCAGLFLILSFITLWSFVIGDSFFIYRDVTWPTDNIDLLTNLFYSVDLELLRRSIYLGPIFAFVKLLGLSSLDAEKLMFIMVRFLTGFLAFFSIYKFISFHGQLENYNRKKEILLFVSIVGGYFYAYNPITTTMVSPTLGFAFSFALTPLAFYFFDKSLYKKDFQTIVIASILIVLTIVGTQQYLVLFPLFLLGPWFAINAARPSNRRLLKTMTTTTLIISGLVVLFSSYWILPSVSSNLGGVPLEPRQYVITTDFLDMVSNNIPLDKGIRLMGDWWPRIDITPIFDEAAWVLLSFVIPAAAISFMVFQKRSALKYYLLVFFLISLLIMFFNKGTQDPFPSFYPMLFDIPFIGWMFRIPSKFGMILAFTMTMIISLGFYGLLSQNAARRIRRVIGYVLPITFLICVSVISWPMFTGDLGGVISENEYPLTPGSPVSTSNEYHITPLTPTDAVSSSSLVSVTPSNQNIAVVGGLDKINLLNYSDYWNSNRTSTIFLDQEIGTTNALGISSYVLAGAETQGLFIHKLPQDAQVLSPFDSTMRYSPTEVFSRDGTDYAINGSFPSNYLDKYSIQTRDLDYGKGLVFTTAEDSLDVPFTISKNGKYEIFLRLLESHQGGMVKIDSDRSSIGSISTLSETDAFVWKHLGSVSYSSGDHIITLDSLRGLNAINLIVIIPTDTLPSMKDQINQMLQNSTRGFIYPLAATDFTSEGTEIGQSILANLPSRNSSTSYLGEVEVPKNTTRMAIEFWARPNSNAEPSSLQISSLNVAPAAESELYLRHSHFESGASTPEAYGYNAENLELSIDTSSPLSGSRSLKANLIDDSIGNSGRLSTGLIPLPSTHGIIHPVMFASTRDVDHLEAKLKFFDRDQTLISDNVVFSAGKNSPKSLYINDFEIPPNAEFVELQFLSKMKPEPQSYFTLDVIAIKFRSFDRPLSFEIFGNSHYTDQADFASISDKSIKFDINSKNQDETTPEDWHKLVSMPIDVTGELRYRYNATLQANNIDAVFSRLVFLSDDVLHTSSPDDYLDQSLLMPSGSEITANFQVLKSSNYTIGVLAKTCDENCTSSLRVKVGNSTENLIPLASNKPELTWFYLKKDIAAGDTAVRVSSVGGENEFKGMIFFQDYAKGSSNNSVPSNGAQLAGNTGDSYLYSSSGSPPMTVSLLDHSRIDPASYFARINASQPFILRLEIPYGSMWRAYINDQSYAPVRIYSEAAGLPSLQESAQFPAINGFLIDDQTGDLSVTIKFLPHDWYHVGLIITGVALIGSLGYVVWQRRKRYGVNMFSRGAGEA